MPNTTGYDNIVSMTIFVLEYSSQNLPYTTEYVDKVIFVLESLELDKSL